MELRTNWCESGSSIAELARVVEDLDNHTKVEKVHSSDFDFLSLREMTDDGFARFFMLDNESIDNFEQGAALKTIKGKASCFNSGLLSETVINANLIMYMRKQCDLKGFMYVSDKAMFTVLQRASLGGEASSRMDTLARNLFLSEAIKLNSGDMSLVYRQDDEGNNVVFALMGSRYERIPQKLVIDATTNLSGAKGAKCLSWKVDHEYTNVNLVFPALKDELASMYNLKDEVMPSIILYTSDIGLACFDAIGGYIIGDSFVITGKIKRKHAGKLDAEALVEDIEDKLLADVRKLPETLAYLSTKDVLDSEELISEIWKDYLSSIPGFVKKNLPIRDLMLEEVKTLPYLTGYDIAMMFITLQERLVGLNESSLYKLREACSEIPYKIKRILDKQEETSSSESSISLLPLYPDKQEDAI